MKGLELSETYFQQVGLPMIREKYPAYINRVAAGLVGDGSECFGFDDRLSRDHDWGPGFCIWLTMEDYQAIGNKLQSALDALPKTFNGFGPAKKSDWGEDRIGVFEIGYFYKKFIGFDHIPTAFADWMVIPENNLAACTNGRVFVDPLKEFELWRNSLLNFYPEDVRLKKIASRCMTIGQSGQYNFLRCVKRDEKHAAQYAETKFCADLISLIFLLNKRYVPFYKWAHKAAKNLTILGEWIHGAIGALITSCDPEEKINLIEEMCAVVIKEFKRQGLSNSKSTFLLDHGPEIQQTIKDNELRGRNVWIG